MGYQPAKSQAELGAELVKAYDIQKLTSCSTCHR
jgi:cytochrome c553